MSAGSLRGMKIGLWCDKAKVQRSFQRGAAATPGDDLVTPPGIDCVGRVRPTDAAEPRSRCSVCVLCDQMKGPSLTASRLACKFHQSMLRV
jgi:hypothetical protein